ncbi:hypothetical protein ACWEV4_28935 [Streptomyces sp. NPDC003860]
MTKAPEILALLLRSEPRSRPQRRERGFRIFRPGGVNSTLSDTRWIMSPDLDSPIGE